MAVEGFLTLTCYLEELEPERYRALFRGGGQSRQSLDFTLPPPATREAWLHQFRQPFAPLQGDRWRLLEGIGTQLFRAIFRDETLATWRLLRQEAQDQNLMLRVVFDVAAPALQPLPWEVLFDPEAHFFLALDPHTCLLRFPRDIERAELERPREPLRILALVSQPRGATLLDVASERATLEEVLAPLTQPGDVQLTWWGEGEPNRPATLSALATEVTRAAGAGQPYDVFHYIGHAGWNAAEEEGALLLVDTAGQRALTSAVALGSLLRQGGLRLGVLNACEGSRGDEIAPFRSVAETLTGASDLPAVIANQIEVSDRAATSFAGAFYSALVQRTTVEEAVTVARNQVATQIARNPEWAATIFFSRFEERPLRLLPPIIPPVARSRPLLTASALVVVTFLMGVATVSLFRLFGPLVGGAFQLGVWGVALWFALDHWVQIRRYWTYAAGALTAATLGVALWFVPFQPTLRTPPVPDTFGVSLEFPSPYIFQDEQLPTTTLSVDVTGRVVALPPGYTLWILVQAENSGTFVAGAPATLLAEGRFLAPDVVVGPPTPRPDGRRYTLQPVLVDAAGDRFLREHRNNFWRTFHPDLRIIPQPRLQSALIRRQ